MMSGKGNEQCVPVNALAMAEEGEQIANPEVGDRVSYTVEGKVTRIEGDKAYVQAQTVNGEAVDSKPEAATPTDEEQDAADFGALQDEANKLGPMPA